MTFNLQNRKTMDKKKNTDFLDYNIHLSKPKETHNFLKYKKYLENKKTIKEDTAYKILSHLEEDFYANEISESEFNKLQRAVFKLFERNTKVSENHTPVKNKSSNNSSTPILASNYIAHSSDISETHKKKKKVVREEYEEHEENEEGKIEKTVKKYKDVKKKYDFLKKTGLLRIISFILIAIFLLWTITRSGLGGLSGSNLYLIGIIIFIVFVMKKGSVKKGKDDDLDDLFS